MLWTHVDGLEGGRSETRLDRIEKHVCGLTTVVKEKRFKKLLRGTQSVISVFMYIFH